MLWVPDHEDRAILLRQHLKAAGVQRAELFTDDAHRKHITFHDLRATGITWAAVRGDDPLRIKQRAGHRSFSTTEGYIREAENLREGFGTVFPLPPPDLQGEGGVLARVLAFGRTPSTAQPKTRGPEWSNGGSNPGPLHCERSALPAELLPRTRQSRTTLVDAPGHERARNIRGAPLKSSTPAPRRYRYPSTSERARRPQPSIATKRSSLKGRLTWVGVIICMPSARSRFATTRSMTRNGR